MTTRRAVLHLAGGLAVGAAGGAVLGVTGGCERQPATAPVRLPGDLLFVELSTGTLAAVDTGTGRAVIAAGPAVISGDGTRIVRTEQPGAATRVTSYRLPGAQIESSGTLTGRLAVRAVSPDGRLLALATPSESGTSPYRPPARQRSTIVVADSAGQRARLDLPGNLEPEAFDISGGTLFVLDYLPPTAPDRYRVRAIDLASGRVNPLVARNKGVVLPGTEEEMRGEGRQAVYDRHSQRLFTLYTHQPDHLHTRDLVAGARENAPHVHAFVHTLSLIEGWAFCVDLPSPFGEGAAAGHAIALSPGGDRLYVVDATSASVAVIDPSALNVVTVLDFGPPAGSVGAASAAVTPDGRLLIGAGRGVITMPATASGPVARWSTPTVVRGVATTASHLYVGQDGGVLRLDRATGRAVQRIALPDLQTLRQVTAPA